MLSLLVSLLVGGVEVAPGTPCVDGRAAERLAAQVPGGVSVALTLARPQVVLVVLSSPGRPSLRREVPASEAECEAVERVVLALVRSWSAMSPRTKRADAGVVASSFDTSSEFDGGTRTQRQTSDAGVRASTQATDAGTPPAQVIARSGLDAGVSTPVITTSALDGGVSTPPIATPALDPGVKARAQVIAVLESDAGVTVTAAQDGTMSATDSITSSRSDAGVIPSLPESMDAGVSPPSDVRIGLSLLGGISSGTTADVLPQGLLSIDLVWRWVGVALDVGLSGGVKQTVAPGEVIASWQWLTLSGRAVWAATERLQLDVQLGARAHRLVASATGFTQNEPAQTLFSIGGVGSLGASLRLLGPVGVTVRASGVVKPPERFVITNVQQALDFGAFEGAVHAGLFVRW